MKRRNQFSNNQNRLLKASLKRLLGNGLIESVTEHNHALESAIIQDALNLNVLDSRLYNELKHPRNSDIKPQNIKHS